MHQVNDGQSASARPRRWLLSCAFMPIGVVALFFAAPFLQLWWQDFTFSRTADKYLEGEVAYVEFQQNTDWPKQRITAPDRHERLLEWLRRTQEESFLRSAPPGCVCELRFVFRDGREEVLWINALREPLTSDGHIDVRDEARIEFRGHCRIGDVVELKDVLRLD